MKRLALIALLWCPMVAGAQDSSPLPEDPAPAGARPKQAVPADPLAGPAVDASAAPRERPSLVKRDFEGKLRELETSLEEAAAALLDLSDDERKQVEEVFIGRWAALDTVVRENFNTLVKFDALNKAGGEAKGEAAALLRELVDAARPVFQGGSLRQQVERALPPEEVEQYRRMIDEYVRAAVEERLAQAKGEGLAMGRLEAGLQVHMELFGKEIERSVYRVVGNLTYFAEEMMKKLDLSPAQESEVRRILEEFGMENGLKPTEEQTRELFIRIAARLKPDQLRKLLSEFR